MKNLAFAALCMGSLGLLACGGGGGSSKPDSGISIGADGGSGADAGSTAACNPSEQSGCTGTDKCTYVIEQTTPDVLGHTDCAANGTVALGGACTRDANGVDDCLAGGFCSGGVCMEICGTTPDSCASGESCVPYSSLFSDADNTGLCNTQCNPLDPSAVCATDEGCFLSLASGSATCATPFLDDPAGEDRRRDLRCQPGHPGLQLRPPERLRRWLRLRAAQRRHESDRQRLHLLLRPDRRRGPDLRQRSRRGPLVQLPPDHDLLLGCHERRPRHRNVHELDDLGWILRWLRRRQSAGLQRRPCCDNDPATTDIPDCPGRSLSETDARLKRGGRTVAPLFSSLVPTSRSGASASPPSHQNQRPLFAARPVVAGRLSFRAGRRPGRLAARCDARAGRTARP